MHDSRPKGLRQLVRVGAFFMAALSGFGTVPGSAVAQQWVIVKSDGKTITVDNPKVNDVRIACQSDGKPQEIPVEQVTAIRNAMPVAPTETKPPILVGLNDGSRLFTDKLLFDGDVFTIRRSAGKDWKLNRRDVAWLRLEGNEQVSIDGMWQDMLDHDNRSGDWLVFKRNDQLDFLEGLIGNISDSAIELTGSGQTNQAPRNRVFGVIFFHGVKKAFAPAVGKLHTINGDEFPTSSLNFTKETISFITIGGVDLEIPTDRFLEFETSKQKFVIVSKLRPTTVEWVPLVANSSTRELQQQWNRPRFDKSFESKTLSLQFPSGNKSWSSHQVVEYSHGIAAKTGTRLVYEINGEFSRLLGVAGVAPELQSTGSADLVVAGDGVELFRKTFDDQVDVPFPVLVDIKNVRRLTVQIDYRNGSGFGGVFHLCDWKLER